jgi:SAM-dependent methyltransferase
MSTTETPFDQATMDYYAEAAPTYRASGPGGRNRFLDEFLSSLPFGAFILDLGCGSGIDAKAMLDAGFSVDAIDASPAIAAQASQRLGQQVHVRRFDELLARDKYDAIWASASLIHVPRTALTALLTNIYQALKPGGRHLATYKAGNAEARDSAGRYYNYPSRGELHAFYSASAPWIIDEITEYTGGGFEAGSGPWLKIAARRLV